ncbi:hypothetical protein [Synechococcus phage Yong-M3-232]|nr:hypothetical protein [Synechococcus phage Yong-M3-232]
MRLIALPAVLLLTACQHTQPAVEIREVPVPVPQPCLSKDDLAALPEPEMVGDRLGRTPETAERDRDILASSALDLRAWGRALFAAHAACAE